MENLLAKPVKVKCSSCGQVVFKTEFCNCGNPLDGSKIDVTKKLETGFIELPDEAWVLIKDWFESYYREHGELPEEHLILAKRFDFIEGE